MHRALNERSYRLIEMIIRKTLQASAFSFIVLNLVEKAISQFLLIILDYIKSALRNKQQITSNPRHFKRKLYMETLKTLIFSFIIVNLVNRGVLHFLITTDK